MVNKSKKPNSAIPDLATATIYQPHINNNSCANLEQEHRCPREKDQLITKNNHPQVE
jgi:hypothetical protein